MDWLMGLQNLVQGAQTNPQAFAQKAASAGVDPAGIEQLLQQQLKLAVGPQTPGQTTGAAPQSFDNMLYWSGGGMQPGFSQTPNPGIAMQPGTTTLPPIGPPTQTAVPGPQASPMLPKAGDGGPWSVVQEGLPGTDDKAGWDKIMQAGPQAPGLTPEQLAKIAGMMPKGGVQAPPAAAQGAGGRGVAAPGQLSVAAVRRPSLAQILSGGR